MKKRVSRIRVNTKKSHSDAMLRNMLRSLIAHGKVTTTSARAKILKRFADREISYAVSLGDEISKNRLFSRLKNPETVRLVSKYAALVKDNSLSGSYVSLVKVGFRAGDNSEMTRVTLARSEEFLKVLEAEKPKKKKKTTTRKSAAPAKKVKQTEKKEEKAKESKPGAEKKDEKKKTPTVPENQLKKPGLLGKLGGRILGRQVRTQDVGGKKGRSTARSGI